MSQLSTSSHSPEVDLYAHRHRALLKKYLEIHKKEISKLPELEKIIRDWPKPAPVSKPEVFSSVKAVGDEAPVPVVGIIGAGSAGLYTAMILQSLGIAYKILEASDRVGGRLFTYHFPGSDQPEHKYDYYDVGAMRFPDTPFMKRTFDLLRNRNLGVDLIDYYFKSDNTFRCYNGISYSTDPAGKDPFRVKDYISANFRELEGVNKFLDWVLDEPRQLFVKNDITTATELLFKNYDSYSTRSWVAHKEPKLTTSDILWLETIDKSTGWYDRALTETVLESVAFSWPGDTSGKPIDWYCFDGGSSVLPEKMAASLKTPVQFGSKVTAISEWEQGTVRVTYVKNGQQESELFTSVICTTPLPRLSFMDLSNTAIITANYPQWSGIRQLRYGPSIKIAIRFKTPWWETLDTGKIVGGQSYTDFPIRTVVYPSYPPDKTKTKPRSPVLIVSYCWTADAERLSALIRPGGKADPSLIPLVLRDLSAVHKVSYKFLTDRFDNTPENYHAWSWIQDPLTAGAFAFFGPGEYSDPMYPKLRAPAARGKLFFAGEALSACHAWVAGALNSTWFAINSYLTLAYEKDPSEENKKNLDNFHINWGTSEAWDDDSTFVEEDKDHFDQELRLGLSLYAKNPTTGPLPPKPV
ncbi:FAD/NAD(P)-binding domain-containing protein [Sistotremastrum niveocremeum HHB9708]|uniref:FAD/NAD(P)-binding domain-containing protein n=2 Tax=Sistotremastraceae TaxID=3402574 RepID=A0A164PAX2_9AGAM|nr:FAD/NAD(P)-binding domain-containing protein [Sistotremastrum niveocremeum HHB9708]KZT32835.1 FAD/NAD(P)-binding domain-containing protein [Sistotremastrum suecicum HHB10207 ss-3]